MASETELGGCPFYFIYGTGLISGSLFGRLAGNSAAG
jgi:hypothetical protein